MDPDKLEKLRERCGELHLSLSDAVRLGRESGYTGAEAACWSVGLDPKTLVRRQNNDWVTIVARAASVSYQEPLPAGDLSKILLTGEVPEQYIAHTISLLDEVPTQLIVLASEDIAQGASIAIGTIWRNISKFVTQFETHRKWFR